MNTEAPNQPPTPRPSLPFLIRGLAWGFLILFGGAVVMMLVRVITSVAEDGWPSRNLLFLGCVAVWCVLFFGLRALTNPIRGRGDERRAWRERFPTHSDQELERFLRLVGEALEGSAKHLRRFRPDDRVASLTQDWLSCGDGMELVELVMALENEYGVQLPDSFYEGVSTLGDFFDYVTRHGTGRSAAAPPDLARKA